MKPLTELFQTLATMPVEGLAAAVILAGFALAAFAIHAVLKLSKERR
jgi:hypothetical protein